MRRIDGSYWGYLINEDWTFTLCFFFFFLAFVILGSLRRGANRPASLCDMVNKDYICDEIKDEMRDRIRNVSKGSCCEPPNICMNDPDCDPCDPPCPPPCDPCDPCQDCCPEVPCGGRCNPCPPEPSPCDPPPPDPNAPPRCPDSMCRPCDPCNRPCQFSQASGCSAADRPPCKASAGGTCARMDANSACATCPGTQGPCAVPNPPPSLPPPPMSGLPPNQNQQGQGPSNLIGNIEDSTERRATNPVPPVEVKTADVKHEEFDENDHQPTAEDMDTIMVPVPLIKDEEDDTKKKVGEDLEGAPGKETDDCETKKEEDDQDTEEKEKEE